MSRLQHLVGSPASPSSDEPAVRQIHPFEAGARPRAAVDDPFTRSAIGVELHEVCFAGRQQK
jgi:hypothetical protein